MKFLRKWLKPDPKQQSAVNESKKAPASLRVRSEEESEGEHSEESSLSWLGIDQADSSIFDTGKLVTEKSEDKDAVPVCGELVFKPRQADGIGLGNDYASSRNVDLQLSVVSSRFSHRACHRPTHNGSAGRCRTP